MNFMPEPTKCGAGFFILEIYRDVSLLTNLAKIINSNLWQALYFNDMNKDAYKRHMKDGARTICLCRGVKKKKILKAIKAGNTTIDAINNKFRTGSWGCGGQRCQHQIYEMLDTGYPKLEIFGYPVTGKKIKQFCKNTSNLILQNL